MHRKIPLSRGWNCRVKSSVLHLLALSVNFVGGERYRCGGRVRWRGFYVNVRWTKLMMDRASTGMSRTICVIRSVYWCTGPAIFVLRAYPVISLYPSNL